MSMTADVAAAVAAGLGGFLTLRRLLLLRPTEFLWVVYGDDPQEQVHFDEP
jgi:hypothetical protein